MLTKVRLATIVIDAMRQVSCTHSAFVWLCAITLLLLSPYPSSLYAPALALGIMAWTRLNTTAQTERLTPAYASSTHR